MNTLHQTNGFVCVPRALLEDTTLTEGDKITYILMKSKCDDWKFYHYNLAKELKCSRKTISRRINALVNAGWVKRGKMNYTGSKYPYMDYLPLDTKNGVEAPIEEAPTKVADTPKKADTPKPRVESGTLRYDAELENDAREIFKIYPDTDTMNNGVLLKTDYDMYVIEDMLKKYDKSVIASRMSDYITTTARQNKWFKSLRTYLYELKAVLEREVKPKVEVVKKDVSEYYFVPSDNEMEWTDDCYGIAEKVLEEFDPQIIAEAQRQYPYAFRNYENLTTALNYFYSDCERVRYEQLHPNEEDEDY